MSLYKASASNFSCDAGTNIHLLPPSYTTTSHRWSTHCQLVILLINVMLITVWQHRHRCTLCATIYMADTEYGLVAPSKLVSLPSSTNAHVQSYSATLLTHNDIWGLPHSSYLTLPLLFLQKVICLFWSSRIYTQDSPRMSLPQRPLDLRWTPYNSQLTNFMWWDKKPPILV